MNFYGIAFFTLRASLFAAVVCGLYALVWRLRRRRITPGRVVAVFYVAALIQITVLRGGVEWEGFLQAPRDGVQWIPMLTALDQMRRGAWPLIYHVVGNIGWFAPLGVILRKKPVWAAFLAGALLSVVIESLQWALMTGMPDIEDVIWNACGAGLGRLFAGLIAKRRAQGADMS